MENAAGIAALLKEAEAKQVQLLPFHQFEESKYHKLCQAYAYENAAALHEDDLKAYRQVFLNHGIHTFF